MLKSCASIVGNCICQKLLKNIINTAHKRVYANIAMKRLSLDFFKNITRNAS